MMIMDYAFHNNCILVVKKVLTDTLHNSPVSLENTLMNHRLLIVVVTLIALVSFIYVLSKPEEVVAPVEESVSPSALDTTNETPSEEGSTSAEEASLPNDGRTNSEVRTTLSQITFGDSPTSPQATTQTYPYTAVVVYNGDRFIPEEVTVIAGGTVRFVNTSDKEMWVASDNHPTHTRYPIKDESDCRGSSFDQCKAVGGGESWSFAFTRTGTWGYHNHMRAQDGGEVVVRTEEEYLKSL